MVRTSNRQHMDARRLPAVQSGPHYLTHTGIIKESDQRADYFRASGFLSVCSFFMLLFIRLCCLFFSPSLIRYDSNLNHMEAMVHPSP